MPAPGRPVGREAPPSLRACHLRADQARAWRPRTGPPRTRLPGPRGRCLRGGPRLPGPRRRSLRRHTRSRRALAPALALAPARGALTSLRASPCVSMGAALHCAPLKSKGEAMTQPTQDILRGTLDLLILKALSRGRSTATRSRGWIEAGDRRCAGGRRGHALPGAAPAGGAGLDRRRAGARRRTTGGRSSIRSPESGRAQLRVEVGATGGGTRRRCSRRWTRRRRSSGRRRWRGGSGSAGCSGRTRAATWRRSFRST